MAISFRDLDEPPLRSRHAPPIAILRVVPWTDGSQCGEFDPRSRYVERFWLSVLGPSAVWMLRRLAEGLDDHPEGFELDLDDLACRLGLGRSSSRHSPLRRAIGRCAHFGLVLPCDDDVLKTRQRFPPVPRRHVLRMPIELQEEHRGWQSIAATANDGLLLRRRARLLALDLRELDVDVASIELRLLRRGIHPATAFEAAHWAWSAATGADQVKGVALSRV